MAIKLIVTFTCVLLVANGHGTYVANYASSYNAHAINHDIRAGVPVVNAAYTPVAAPTGYQVSFPLQQAPIGSSLARLAAPFAFTQLPNAQFIHQLNPTPITAAPSDVSFINVENRVRVSPNLSERTKSSQPDQSQEQRAVQSPQLNPTFQTAPAPRAFYNPSVALPQRRLYETPRVENEDEEENQANQPARIQNLAKAAPAQRNQQQQQQQQQRQQQQNIKPILRMTEALITPANGRFRAAQSPAQQQTPTQASENLRSFHQSAKLADENENESVEIKSSDSNEETTPTVRTISGPRLTPVFNPVVPNFYGELIRF